MTRTRNALLAVALCATSASAQRSALPALPEWRLDATPLVSIGGDGDASTEFHRISAVWRLSDGGIAVVNGGSNEIRAFDARGKLTATFGRTGRGPGEFERIGWSGHLADTAFVYDGSTRRVSRILLGAKPRLVGDATITAKSDRRFGIWGRAADGRWLVSTNISPTFEQPAGVHRITASIGLLPADGAGTVEWIGEGPSGAMFVYNPTGDVKQAAVGPIAFTPWFNSTTSGSAVWFGDTGSDSVVRYDVASKAKRRVVLPFIAVAPSAAQIAAERDPELKRAGPGPGFSQARYTAQYLPKLLPYYGTLVPGFAGELWVEQYSPTRAPPIRYVVLSAQGVPVASVMTAAGFRIRDIGRDYVVGMYQDDDGLESVRMYRLARR